MRYAPTLTAEKGASKKHLSAPVGSFVGRIQYAPTRVHRKRGIQETFIRPFGSFVGRMLLRPILTDENGASNKHESAPSGRFVGRIRYAPTGGQQKTEDRQQKSRVRTGGIQLRTRRFSLFVFWGGNFYNDAPAAIRRGCRCIFSGCWRSK